MRDDLDIPMPMGSPSYRVARRSSGMDPNTRRLALIAGGIGGALLLLVGGYALTGHHSRDGVPLVTAAAGPVRVKPVNPGGMNVVGGDEQDPTGKNMTEALAAPAETPDPKALQSQEQAAAAPGSASAPATVAANPASSSVARQAALTATDPAPSATAPVAVSANPEMPAPAAARPAPASRSPASPAPASSGATQVQLAALTSEEAAMAEWSRLSRKMPDLFAARRPAVTRTERDGKTWFRLRLGGFSDTAQAASFCAHVREKGGGCSLATF